MTGRRDVQQRACETGARLEADKVRVGVRAMVIVVLKVARGIGWRQLPKIMEVEVKVKRASL